MSTPPWPCTNACSSSTGRTCSRPGRSTCGVGEQSVTVRPMSPDSYVLAGSDVTIPLLGVGTWAWGDRSTWGMGGYDADLNVTSIEEAFDASVDAGVTLFDTAEVY